MEDVTLTQLFERMDAHLLRQDAHLAQQDVVLQTIITNMAQQNTLLVQTAQMLATTTREVAEIHAEASRGFAGAMHLLSNLVNRLEEDR